MLVKQILEHNIERYRKRKGLTQMQLAAKAGVHFSTLNMIVKKPTRNITLFTLSAIADALDVSVIDLLTSEVQTPRWATMSDMFWYHYHLLESSMFLGSRPGEIEMRRRFDRLYDFWGYNESHREPIWKERNSYGFDLSKTRNDSYNLQTKDREEDSSKELAPARH